jgi:chromate transporter
MFLPGGVAGGVVALIAIFLPGILLVWAALPFWDVVRTSRILRRMLAGVGAAVVGLLAAALYNPVWTGAVGSAADAVVAIAALAALLLLRAPPLACVVACAAVAQILGLT